MTSIDICWRWGQLLVAIALVVVEWVCRDAFTIICSLIPDGTWFLARAALGSSSSSSSSSSADPNCERGTIEYIQCQGYDSESHFVTTADGYVLGLHRVPARPVCDGADTLDPDIRPVLIVHGFMHCSEAFTIRHCADDSLPLVLNKAGYDVWLGNNRGNKYSHKHVSKKPKDDDFWDFSLDDMARYDLPSMIDYVLAQTGAPSLTLVGFSQGTAQGFAYLSCHPYSSKVNLFIPLAPVIVPRGFANPVVDSLARARPDFIFLLFGKRQLLPSTLFWRNNLPRPIFVALIDFSLKFLFGWDTACLSEKEKPLLYSHIYAHASVKTVVQWFQIIQTRKFQMFDDYKSANVSSYGSETYPGYVLPTYELGQIRTPIACFCGGRDTLPNTAELLASLPQEQLVSVHIEDKYEHLDFMWATDVAVTVFPKILGLLAKFNRGKEEDCCEL